MSSLGQTFRGGFDFSNLLQVLRKSSNLFTVGSGDGDVIDRVSLDFPTIHWELAMSLEHATSSLCTSVPQ